jgi:hypothetical protein
LDFIAANPASAILVSLDGGPPINIATERFLAISPQLTVDLAEPNFVGAPGGQRTTFAVAGYQAMIRPLSTGSHTITVTHDDGTSADWSSTRLSMSCQATRTYDVPLTMSPGRRSGLGGTYPAPTKPARSCTSRLFTSTPSCSRRTATCPEDDAAAVQRQRQRG